MGKKLSKYAKKSSVMDVVLRYGDEKILFNLAEELVVDENRINEELQTQPGYYGFLSLLLNKLDRVRNDKKASLTKKHSELFIKYKSKVDPNTQRIYSNDLAEANIQMDSKYQAAIKAFNKAEEEYGIIKSCTRSFEQRAHLIQSLSANVRDEKRNS